MIRTQALKTPLFKAGDNLYFFIENALKSYGNPRSLLESKILVISSKIVSIFEERQIKLGVGETKLDLIKKEADEYLGEGPHGAHITISRGLLIPTAGIDESNSESNSAEPRFITYPVDPYKSAQKLWRALALQLKVQNFGVLICDSRSNPLRLGVNGVTLSHWGFRGLKSRINDNDLFRRPLKFTKVNIADALAASAVLDMGEANESQPLALVEYEHLEFCGDQDMAGELQVSKEQDLYSCLFI